MITTKEDGETIEKFKKIGNLMKEAEADFKLKNFNKYASACYFSVRKALEDMFIRMGIMITEKTIS